MEFQYLHLFLQKQEHLLLAQLSELEKKIEEMQEENSIGLCDTFSHLDDLIGDLEKKSQQSACEFLQVSLLLPCISFSRYSYKFHSFISRFISKIHLEQNSF